MAKDKCGDRLVRRMMPEEDKGLKCSSIQTKDNQNM